MFGFYNGPEVNRVLFSFHRMNSLLGYIKSENERMDLSKLDLKNHLLPETLEQDYYRSIFEKYYSGSGDILDFFWMPKFVNATDSSARTLDIYKEKNNM